MRYHCRGAIYTVGYAAGCVLLVACANLNARARLEGSCANVHTLRAGRFARAPGAGRVPAAGGGGRCSRHRSHLCWDRQAAPASKQKRAGRDLPLSSCPGGNPGTRVRTTPAPCGAVLTMNSFILGIPAAQHHTVNVVFSPPTRQAHNRACGDTMKSQCPWGSASVPFCEPAILPSSRSSSAPPTATKNVGQA